MVMLGMGKQAESMDPCIMEIALRQVSCNANLSKKSLCIEIFISTLNNLHFHSSVVGIRNCILSEDAKPSGPRRTERALYIQAPQPKFAQFSNIVFVG